MQGGMAKIHESNPKMQGQGKEMSSKTPLDFDFIKQFILDIKDRRARALVAFQYVTGSRIGECIKCWHWVLSPEAKKRRKRNPDYHTGPKPSINEYTNSTPEMREGWDWIGYYTSGIQKKDFVDRGEYLEVKRPNFKNNKKPWLYSPIMKEGPEAWIYEEVLDPWLSQYHEPTSTIFPWKYTKARELVSEAMRDLGKDEATKKAYSSHHLRHSRGTHLPGEYGYNAYEVRDSLGHSKLDTSNTYVTTASGDRAEKLKTIKR